jgi:hypothetical protein
MSDPRVYRNEAHPHSLEVISYHEAGHVVTALGCGCSVPSVTVERIPDMPNGWYQGNTNWGHLPLIPRYELDIYRRLGAGLSDQRERSACILVAGKAAERLWYGEADAAVTHATFGESDEFALDELFETWAKQIHESREAFVRHYEHMVLEILRQPHCWQALEAIASALIDLVRRTTSPARLERRGIDSLVLRALSSVR